MPTLSISFTSASPVPANGYRVKYWNVNTPGTIITVSPNPTTSPVSISGVVAGCYAGTVESACSGGVFSSTVSFNACSGNSYCVAVTKENNTEASSECSGVTDSFTIYTFTLKDSSGNTVNAPSNVTVTFNGWTNYPGGAGAFNGTATILTGNSSTTSTVYTSQALNGAPGCPCPCATTTSIDENSFAASIAAPSTVSICALPYDCISGNCVQVIGGPYATLAACQAVCTSGGGGTGGGGGGSNCVCCQPVDGGICTQYLTSSCPAGTVPCLGCGCDGSGTGNQE